uniref:Uncharacterized protein n=1 Tax=Arundo donax TaxID=35708 RepID=A0A0A9EGT6_ARUDO
MKLNQLSTATGRLMLI